ncbi:unnamed protein product [Didymodactylos carnosus]|uniref:Uncharacterized protein n=1 Tax=Didymodactylos carnosus TaxID=1234261 RepID=A0A814C405_9BILA|nr:unnamed protein product [Didymodactylos carnosus]CAF3713683.1 unnamed protein product [Didymodactylos carnosus]
MSPTYEQNMQMDNPDSRSQSDSMNESPKHARINDDINPPPLPPNSSSTTKSSYLVQQQQSEADVTVIGEQMHPNFEENNKNDQNSNFSLTATTTTVQSIPSQEELSSTISPSSLVNHLLHIHNLIDKSIFDENMEHSLHFLLSILNDNSAVSVVSANLNLILGLLTLLKNLITDRTTYSIRQLIYSLHDHPKLKKLQITDQDEDENIDENKEIEEQSPSLLLPQRTLSYLNINNTHDQIKLEQNPPLPPSYRPTLPPPLIQPFYASFPTQPSLMNFAQRNYQQQRSHNPQQPQFYNDNLRPPFPPSTVYRHF